MLYTQKHGVHGLTARRPIETIICAEVAQVEGGLGWRVVFKSHEWMRKVRETFFVCWRRRSFISRQQRISPAVSVAAAETHQDEQKAQNSLLFRPQIESARSRTHADCKFHSTPLNPKRNSKQILYFQCEYFKFSRVKNAWHFLIMRPLSNSIIILKCFWFEGSFKFQVIRLLTYWVQSR